MEPKTDLKQYLSPDQLYTLQTFTALWATMQFAASIVLSDPIVNQITENIVGVAVDSPEKIGYAAFIPSLASLLIANLRVHGYLLNIVDNIGKFSLLIPAEMVAGAAFIASNSAG